MTINDLRKIIGLCKDEGWNIAINDAAILYHIDPNGHFLLLKNNETIGGISIIKHGHDYFTIGPFIIISSYRQKGCGTYIWQAAMNHQTNLNQSACIGLCAIQDQVTRYNKLGFVTQYINHRWVFDANKPYVDNSIYSYHQISNDMIPLIMECDQNIYPVLRENLFTAMMKDPNIVGYIIQEHGEMAGFGFIRPCNGGYRIGPLVANKKIHAKHLILKLAHLKEKTITVIDSPSINSNMISIAKEIGLSRSSKDDTHLMFKGSISNKPPGNSDRHYAVFSLEIG